VRFFATHARWNRSDVRFAAVFASTNASAGRTWIAVVEPWKGRHADVAQCEAVLGAIVSQQVRIVPVDRVPQTEQGKVDRAQIDARFSVSQTARGPFGT
jgi:fatty-acyl-CoA synthase